MEFVPPRFQIAPVIATDGPSQADSESHIDNDRRDQTPRRKFTSRVLPGSKGQAADHCDHDAVSEPSTVADLPVDSPQGSMNRVDQRLAHPRLFAVHSLHGTKREEEEDQIEAGDRYEVREIQRSERLDSRVVGDECHGPARDEYECGYANDALDAATATLNLADKGVLNHFRGNGTANDKLPSPSVFKFFKVHGCFLFFGLRASV